MWCLCLILAALTSQDAPEYRYSEVPPAEPGTTLYAFMEGGHNVYVAKDAFAHIDLEKSILATDKTGLEELRASGRMFTIPNGTAVKVIQWNRAGLAKAHYYEVRILEGDHRDAKGFVVAGWINRREEAAPKPKPIVYVKHLSPEVVKEYRALHDEIIGFRDRLLRAKSTNVFRKNADPATVARWERQFRKDYDTLKAKLIALPKEDREPFVAALRNVHSIFLAMSLRNPKDYEQETKNYFDALERLERFVSGSALNP